MSKHLRTLAVGAAIVAGLAAAPALYAQDYLNMPDRSTTGQGMGGEGGVMRMMGSMMSGMMNMMGVSGDLDGMMEHCNAMMQGPDGQRPNDSPEEPGQRPQG